MMAFDKIKDCVRDNRCFVLQGGAGSGKTETLKQTLEFISDSYSDKKIACITHTNLAVDEIKSRVGEQYTVSTIHSFLNSFVRDYQKNLQQVIHKLFQLDLIIRQDVGFYGGDETLQKKKEHEKYKKLHNKYSSTFFTVKKERTGKVEGKREYDKEPEGFNASLNEAISALNAEILEIIQASDCRQIKYNETRFNNFHELTFGHDGLLDIAFLLFEKYEMLGKILQDKFDCIFIDEYQDTSEKVINIFLNELPNQEKTLIGLFGDSMQAIYEDGIGDVEKFIADEKLKKINKEDNYRCSHQVLDFINKLRSDGLAQEIAFKKKEDGTEGIIDDRQGNVTLYYSFYHDKPHARSSQDKKDEYIKAVDALVSKASEAGDDFRQLRLTNKSIASDAGFEQLYGIFSDQYAEPLEYMDRHLLRLQFTDLFELCQAYKPLNEETSPNYNLVLSWLKKQGFSIKSIADKQKVKDKFEKIINSEKSAFKTLNDSFTMELLKKSDSHSEYLERKDKLLDELQADTDFGKFKKLFLNGKNTLPRIKDDLPDLEQDDFNELKRDVKREIFYDKLFSDELKFQEIINYFHYRNEDTQYITMHKTKGSGIDNVLVVLEEYFWNEYDFKTVFSEIGSLDKKHKNQKLVYVACSRAKTNLICVRLVSDENEEKEIASLFENSIKV